MSEYAELAEAQWQMELSKALAEVSDLRAQLAAAARERDEAERKLRIAVEALDEIAATAIRNTEPAVIALGGTTPYADIYVTACGTLARLDGAEG